MEMFVGAFSVVFVVLLLLILGVLMAAAYGYLIMAYILEGKALSAIARRRGIERPWLAWIPIGSAWMLGAISDQYRYVTYGQVRNRRKLLMALAIVLYAVIAVILVALGVWSVASISSAMASDLETLLSTYLIGILLIYLMMFVLYGVAVVLAVFQHMACYDLFSSCDPGKRLPYLLISIFVGYPLPFFLYSCRNKDLGMPPRRDEQVCSGE